MYIERLELMIPENGESKAQSSLAAVVCQRIDSSRMYCPQIGLSMSLARTLSHKLGYIFTRHRWRLYEDTCLTLRVGDQVNHFQCM